MRSARPHHRAPAPAGALPRQPGDRMHARETALPAELTAAGPAPRPIPIRRLFESLDARLDVSTWWPAHTDFERMVGAVLVQHTAWPGAARSVEALRAAVLLEPAALAAAAPERVQHLVRASGFMASKAGALIGLARWLLGPGTQAGELADAELRTQLLAVRGVGPETADVIALYAFRRPVFVWDASARTVLERAGYAVPAGYEAAREALGPQVAAAELSAAEHARFHGLLVEARKALRVIERARRA